MRAAMYDTYRLPQGKVVADLDGADGNILIQLHRGTPAGSPGPASATVSSASYSNRCPGT